MKRTLAFQLTVAPWFRFVPVVIIFMFSTLIVRYGLSLFANDNFELWMIYHSGLTLRTIIMIPYIVFLSGYSVLSPFLTLTLLYAKNRSAWLASKWLVFMILTITYCVFYECIYLFSMGFDVLPGYPWEKALSLFIWLLFWGTLQHLLALMLKRPILSGLLAFLGYNADMMLASGFTPTSRFTLYFYTGLSGGRPLSFDGLPILIVALLALMMTGWFLFLRVSLTAHNVERS